MKSLVFLAIMVALTIFGISMVEAPDASWFVLAAPTGALAAWMTVCILVSISSHMDDLSELHSATLRVAAAEERVVEVRKLSANETGLPDSLLALQQDNNPVTSYMSHVNRAISDVNNEKDRKANAVGKIASRAIGPFGFVVTVFGSSTPA